MRSEREGRRWEVYPFVARRTFGVVRVPRGVRIWCLPGEEGEGERERTGVLVWRLKFGLGRREVRMWAISL